jgi:hypothetical protein
VKTRLREMSPADLPAVEALLREQNERDQTSYAVPVVFDQEGKRVPNVALALVAVDSETGQVVQGYVFERTIEMMCFGTDPQASIETMHEQAGIFYLLLARGYRDLHIAVPKNRAQDVEGGLDRILGMVDTSEFTKHFYRLLDPAENLKLREWYKDQEVGNVA